MTNLNELLSYAAGEVDAFFVDRLDEHHVAFIKPDAGSFGKRFVEVWCETIRRNRENALQQQHQRTNDLARRRELLQSKQKKTVESDELPSEDTRSTGNTTEAIENSAVLRFSSRARVSDKNAAKTRR